MSRKNASGPHFEQVETETWWPTAMRSRRADGRVVGTDGSVWLYRAVPTAAIVDAKSPREQVEAASPLLGYLSALAAETRVARGGRRTSKSAYRNVHVLAISIPKLWTPDSMHPLAGYLSGSYHDELTYHRVMLVGIELRPSLISGSGSVRQQLAAGLDSLVDTFTAGVGTPLADFDRDLASVSATARRCGMVAASSEDMRLADAWYTLGGPPDTPMVHHPTHSHIFNSPSALQTVARGDVTDCSSWPRSADQTAVTVAAVENFEYDRITAADPEALWGAQLWTAGALAVSTRGMLEPAKVTAEELTRRRKKNISDIQTRMEAGKLSRADQDERLSALEQIEDRYRTGGGTPTLTEASTLVAFDGIVDDLDTTLGDLVPRLRPMQYRHKAALFEMMLASRVRANPLLHDMPSDVVATAGINSLARVGDREGAVLGFTELDRQAALVSNRAASVGDTLPLMSCYGSTGSGKTQIALWLANQWARTGVPCVFIDPKALALDERLITPDGSVSMGDVEVGDTLIGRDGKPCTVTHLSPIFEKPDLYEIVLDDGQVITADAEHQWVVHTMFDRRRISKASTPEARERAERFRKEAHALDTLMRARGNSMRPALVSELRDDLAAVDVRSLTSRGNLRKFLAKRMNSTGSSPVRYPWSEAMGRVLEYLHQRSVGQDVPLREMTTRQLIDAGVRTSNGIPNYSIPLSVAPDLSERDLPVDPYLLGAWLGDGSARSGDICVGDQDVAEMTEIMEQVWPGVTVSKDGGTRSTWNMRFSMDTSRCGRGHDAWAKRTSRPGRYCAACGTQWNRMHRTGTPHDDPRTNVSLHEQLRTLELLGNRHIPAAYLRASAGQRLALLQGLMDTDGTVKRGGSCRFVQNRETIARGLMELVRSLGIKATINTEPSVITERDEDGTRTRRVTGTSWVVSFRTSKPVFRLSRKLDLLPSSVSPKHSRSAALYIREIRPVPSRPARCVRVDSADHTYLCAGFVPTHNSGSDHSAAVLLSGGRVASLDDLVTADGVFDPLLFSTSAAEGKDMAASMLMAINPWGPDASKFETPLTVALDTGVRLGARTVGQALTFARDAGAAPEEMVEPVLALRNSSAMFAACIGMDASADGGLRVSDKITYVRVGSAHLDLPEPGAKNPTLTQRIAMALVRMMVFGSAAAVRGRDGVVMLDEAWVFLAGEGGRTEIERLGRLARSQRVLPMLFTQRPSDVLSAGLAGYISRSLILPIKDEDEAAAALAACKLEVTPERMSRITAAATMGTSGQDETAPNWHSMRALRDPVTREILRGTIAYYQDLSERVVPVEVRIPHTFMSDASTSPEDVERRLRAQRDREQVEQEAQQAVT
ncbi:ATP-binding protein [Isoptericola croceus]|uniref:ATP-binding protein n=1 Tax=Isoptericola croceus TaxID=3031406 RepID=UPI0023F66760|nr:ATP-binding protein [Isoptericola croceus]